MNNYVCSSSPRPTTWSFDAGDCRTPGAANAAFERERLCIRIKLAFNDIASSFLCVWGILRVHRHSIPSRCLGRIHMFASNSCLYMLRKHYSATRGCVRSGFSPFLAMWWRTRISVNLILIKNHTWKRATDVVMESCRQTGSNRIQRS